VVFLCFAAGTSRTEGQTFQVTSDAAVFVDQVNGTKVIGTLPRGSLFYAVERGNGWYRAMVPQAKELGWVRRDANITLILSDQVDAEREAVASRKKAVWAAARSGRNTGKALADAGQWAQDMERVYGALHPVSPAAYSDVSQLYMEANAFDEAKRVIERSEELYTSLYGRQSKQVAGTQLDLARIAIETGDLADAGRYAKSSAMISANLFGEDHPSVADANFEMGMAMLSGSLNEDALSFFSRAHASYKKHLGESSEKAVKVKSRMAYVYEESGNIPQAISTYEECLRALNMRKGEDRSALDIDSMSLKLMLVKVDPSDQKTIGQAMKEIANYKSRYPDQDEYAGRIEERLVGSLLASDEAGHRTAAIGVMDDAIRRKRLQLRKELWGIAPEKQADYLSYVGYETFFKAITAAVQANDNPVAAELSIQWLINAKGLVNEVQTAQAAGNDLQRREAFAAVPYVTLADVKSRLPLNSAYVEMLRYIEVDLESGSLLTPRYAAWIVRKDDSPQIVDLGRAVLIDDGVVSSRRRIANAQTSIKNMGEVEAFKQLQASLRRTSDRIWKPIEAAIGDVERVVICPDQATWLLPWAAMLNSDGSFAIEKYQIQLQVTGRDLLQTHPLSNNPPVIFADPDYGEESQVPMEDDHIRMEVAERLKTSNDEAQAARPSLERLMRKPVAFVTRAQATESSFKSLQGPSVVMVSSHGFFLNAEGQVMRAAAIQSANGPSHSEAMAANPMLRCGLMLADCNQHISIDRMENDGILSGAEIAKVNLRGTRLAVLSACETGLGSLEATGGVIGLQSAFHEAGAQCVVSTLWKVPDASTSDLTGDFFRELAGNRDVLASVQSAQKAAIARRKSQHGVANPYFWAAFNVSGSTEF
jgi:CHAT domain-containing protein